MLQNYQKEDTVSSSVNDDVGFTMMHLLTSLSILVIAIIVAIIGFNIIISKANKITIKHDLRSFIKVQENYFIEKGCYLGTAGDYIQSGKPSSVNMAVHDFPFIPSSGVKIEIISGDGCNYQGPPAFKAAVTHSNTKLIFEYDFSTRQTTERKR